MDPVISTGLMLSLAPLFSVCIEYFGYVHTAQALSEDLELLLLKLDLEADRFSAWGEANGISRTIDEGRNSELDAASKRDLIERSLKSIKGLFENGRELNGKYGLRAVGPPAPGEQSPRFPSSAGISRFRKSYAKLSRGVTNQIRPSILAKTRWAIYDKTKFAVLITDVRELVDGLYSIVPVANKDRDKIVIKDIRALLPDLARLKMVETASEISYPNWSEAASLIGAISEAGTVDGRRSVGNWVERVVEESKSNNRVTSHHQRSSGAAIFISRWSYCANNLNRSFKYFECQGSLFLVYTPQCLTTVPAEICHEDTFRSKRPGLLVRSFDVGNDYLHTWKLGKKDRQGHRPINQ